MISIMIMRKPGRWFLVSGRMPIGDDRVLICIDERVVLSHQFREPSHRAQVSLARRGGFDLKNIRGFQIREFFKVAKCDHFPIDVIHLVQNRLETLNPFSSLDNFTNGRHLSDELDRDRHRSMG